MKRSLLIMGLFCLVLSSCKKDYVCTCTYAPAGGTVTSGSFEMKGIREKNAKDDCNQMGASWIAAGGTCDFK